MNSGNIKSTILIAAIALGASGCESLPPGENTPAFSASSAEMAGSMARPGSITSAQSAATGNAGGALVSATTYVIAKHQATERQRRIARERAQKFVKALTPEKKAVLKKKRVRFIAVDTVMDERSSPKAKKAVMVFDTQSQELVGNSVYDLDPGPVVGSTAKFETVSAEYVGAGI